MPLKIYHISQSEVSGYDTYSDAVVIAESTEHAKTIYPGYIGGTIPLTISSGDWTNNPKDVEAIEIGIANDTETVRVVCASFHAG